MWHTWLTGSCNSVVEHLNAPECRKLQDWSRFVDRAGTDLHLKPGPDSTSQCSPVSLKLQPLCKKQTKKTRPTDHSVYCSTFTPHSFSIDLNTRKLWTKVPESCIIRCPGYPGAQNSKASWSSGKKASEVECLLHLPQQKENVSRKDGWRKYKASFLHKQQ